jgi:MFS family permease
MLALNTATRPAALAPFGVRSFRFQWAADLTTSWAFEIEALILGWYILVETKSVMLLVTYGALQYCGALISPFFGLAGDRVGYRKIFIATRAIYSLLALSYCVLIFSGALNPLLALCLATVCGALRPSDNLLRNALIAQTLPATQLTGGLGISRLTYDSAKIAGALTGVGVVALFGMGWAYVLVLVMYFSSFLLTFGIDLKGKGGISIIQTERSVWGELSESFVYAWKSPVLMGCICFAFLVNLLAYPFFLGLLPYVAKNIYELNQTGFGLLNACYSLGGLLGSVALATNRYALGTVRAMIFATCLWFVVIFAFAQATSLLLGYPLLLAAGFLQSLCLVPIASIMLRHTEPRFWGRMMGIRMLAIWGLPAGLLLAGPLIDTLGFRWTAMVYAVAGLIATFAIIRRWRDDIWASSAPANGQT